MHIPTSLPQPSPLAGDLRSQADGSVRATGSEARSPAVKLELSSLARRPSFPPSPELKDLAANLEPKERAQQLAAALDGPGGPVALKLATLKMMLAGETLPTQSTHETPGTFEGPDSSVLSSREDQDSQAALASNTQVEATETRASPPPSGSFKTEA